MADGMEFREPSDLMFNFNNPYGACPVCEGFGKVLGISEELVIPNKTLSVYQNAVKCWNGEKMNEWISLRLRKTSFGMATATGKVSTVSSDGLTLGRIKSSSG